MSRGAARFIRFLGRYPKEGEEREVRYGIYSSLRLTSNVGRGRVDAAEVEKCRGDRMTVNYGAIEEVCAIARGTVLLSKDWLNLRVHAVKRLASMKDPRAHKILAELAKDEDEAVRNAATEGLK